MTKKQLIVKLHAADHLDRVERGAGVFKKFENLTLLTWPDGRLCVEATAYLRMLVLEKHQATLLRGGTPRTKAFHLSHLIRFCYRNIIDFIDLTNEHISECMQSLIGRVDGGDCAPIAYLRNGTTAHTIACDWLDFLEFVGELHGRPNFIGKNGQIKATRVSKETGGKSGRPKRTIMVWRHSALPTRDEYRTRHAISAQVLKSLTAAISKSVEPGKFAQYRKRRLHLILRVLRTFGIRRAELCMLKVSDIIAAMKKEIPKLTVTSVKKGGLKTREIETNHAELNEILQFVKYFRAGVIRATCGEANDDGYLFVSAVTGKRLSDNTITQWMHALRLAAGVEEQACAHMFRHLFAVERLCRLMEKHNKNTRDSFKQAMLDNRALKLEVMQELGHANEDTLDIYLQDAEAMLADLQEMKKSVRADLLDESLRACERQHTMRLADGVPESISLRIFHESVLCIQRDAAYLRS